MAVSERRACQVLGQARVTQRHELSPPSDEKQLRDLNRLKEWLYRQRTKIRLERDRAERRQQKEEEAAREKAEQPALFES